MDIASAIRLICLYAHLLLCVFALHSVITTDWRLLRSRMEAHELDLAHHLLVRLLAALWFSGLLIVAIDTGFDPAVMAQKPKLLTKLICVTLLTLNGGLMRVWCLPRLSDKRALGRGEGRALMVFGAVSSASWLMSAFIGIARPLQSLQFVQCLSLYGLALTSAIIVALSLGDRVLRQWHPSGGTQYGVALLSKPK